MTEKEDKDKLDSDLTKSFAKLTVEEAKNEAAKQGFPELLVHRGLKEGLLKEWIDLYASSGAGPPLDSLSFNVSVPYEPDPKVKHMGKGKSSKGKSHPSDSRSSSSSSSETSIDSTSNSEALHSFKSKVKSLMTGEPGFIPPSGSGSMINVKPKSTVSHKEHKKHKKHVRTREKSRSLSRSPARHKSRNRSRTHKHKRKKRHQSSSPDSDSEKSRRKHAKKKKSNKSRHPRSPSASSDSSPDRKHSRKHKSEKHNRSQSRRRRRNKKKRKHQHRSRSSSSSSSSSHHSSSRSRHSHRRAGKDLNSPNVKFTGSSAPPLQYRSEKSRARKSILSGKYANVSQLVAHQEHWPHTCMDGQLSGQPPEYDDMSYCQFFAGSIGKVLREIHPDAVGTHTENQLRHLFRLATYGTKTTREGMLKMNENLFLALEAGQLDWDSWKDIKGHHERYLDSIRLAGNSVPDPGKPNAEKFKKDKQFVSTDYMRSNAICFKFQNYVCEHQESHILEGTNGTVLHICGLCHMSKKTNVPGHGYKQCPLKREN